MSDDDDSCEFDGAALEREMGEAAVRLGRVLSAAAQVVTTAESCTGGWIAQAITSVAGSSAWFDRGFVTYSNAAKSEMLGVAPQLIAEHGAVSEAVVLAMARGALQRSEASLSVAVSGVAGPGGGSAAKPVGTVCLAFARAEGSARASLHRLHGDRQGIRAAAVVLALEGLERCCAANVGPAS